MRQRNIKHLDEKIEALSMYLLKEPEKNKGKWRDFFGMDGALEIEIGSGKGQFITKKAVESPDRIFVGIEGQKSVLLRCLEKVRDNGLRNLLFMDCFVTDMNDFFEPGEVDKIYLNFSDPWPKDRHARRRLTHRSRLKTYFEVLKDGAAIEFKTDNDELFIFTMEEIEDCGYEVLEFTRDLHSSDYESRFVTTEYEDRFSGNGKNINYVKFRK